MGKGENNGFAKITNAEAIKIINSKDIATAKELAVKYNVSQITIRRILTGYYWSATTGQKYNSRKKLSIDVVKELYWLTHFSGISAREIASICNVTTSTVNHIKFGHNHSKITGHVKNSKPAYFEMPESLQSKLSALNQQSTTQPVAVDFYSIDYWLGI